MHPTKISSKIIGRNAATRVHSNPGSSADQFDWEGHKIKGNRKKTPRKCPFQGRNLKVTTPEEGRGKEKVETCSVAVPSEVGFFGVQWRSSPHNLDQYRGKIEFSTLLADLRRRLNTIPHLRSLLQVSHDPNPRKKTPAEQYWRFPGAAKMLQLAKDLEIFHLTRHAKERKDRSSTSFSPPFELFLRQHRSSAVPRRLSLFFCRYGIAMTSNMVAVPRHAADMPAWIQHAFFFVSLYLRPLLTNEELSICSRTFVTSSMTATIEVLVLVVFLVFASVLEVLQSISCLPCAPQTSLASRENFCASFFFGSTTGHCPSPYQIVAIQRLWRRWATFSQKRCPCIGFIFRCRTAAHRRRQACLVDRHCLRSGAAGQPTKCTKPLPWSAVSSWSIFVLFLKRHTGSDTGHHGARAERRNSSITSRSTAVRHFFCTFPERPHTRPASDVPCRMSRSSTWFRPTGGRVMVWIYRTLSASEQV